MGRYRKSDSRNLQQQTQPKEEQAMDNQQIEQQPKEDQVGKYVPEKGTERFVHVEIEKKQFSQETGERLSKPRIQYYDPKEWIVLKESTEKTLGYTVKVLYQPK